MKPKDVRLLDLFSVVDEAKAKLLWDGADQTTEITLICALICCIAAIW